MFINCSKTLISDFLREEAFRNNLDIWFAYCSFEYAESREAGLKFFANTIQLMLNSGSQFSTDLLQFTLGFVRLELDLDKVLNHFLYHTISAVDTCQACRRRSTKSDDGSVQKSKMTALKFLVSVINGDASGLMDSAKVTTPTEIVRAMKRLENDQETVEFLHAKVLLIYLSKGKLFPQLLKFLFYLFFLFQAFLKQSLFYHLTVTTALKLHLDLINSCKFSCYCTHTAFPCHRPLRSQQ